MHSANFKKSWIILLMSLFLFVHFPSVKAEENFDDLFVIIGDALMQTKEANWSSVESNIDQFTKEWNAIKKPSSKLAQKVDSQLSIVQDTLKKDNKDPQKVNQLLSDLSKAVQKYDNEQNPVDKEKEKEKVKQLLPLVENIQKSIESKNFDQANRDYKLFLSAWNSNELIVRNASVFSYGEIEKQSAFLRIAITQEPPSKDKAMTALTDLTNAINNFLSGNVQKKSVESYKLSDGLKLLSSAQKKISDKDFSGATADLNEFLTIWPMIEGEVQTRDSKLYSDLETKVPTIISLISSKKVDSEKAETIIKDLIKRVGVIADQTSYTAWDAALILLREGLEALLLVATLVAFLKKTNQAGKQKWIWSGVAIGLLASGVLAIIINMIFSKMTGASSREYIEGIAGIVAVLMMLTVGAWLHKKSNIKNWNQYIQRQMNDAIATGSLFSFGLISFLAIFREGAETIIFYAGMAPSMSISQLLLGIGVALVILIVIGFVIIHYSVKIPIRLFFTIATILIYFFAFKILGVSIHALQISNVIPTHTIEPFVFIQSIGLYPTWETFIPQIVLIIFVIVAAVWVRNHNKQRA